MVAADKDALVSAIAPLGARLSALTDAANPYRSTAGEFLDKVFSYQVSLPALRSRSLGHFAETLVEDRAGIWKELRDTGQLNDVVYALIPSHVASPRHVKVLLNNFVANARIAASRGLDVTHRGAELAILTVFQTEFPLVIPYLTGIPTFPMRYVPSRRQSDPGANDSRDC